MSPGPTFDRVYHALREQLIGGRFPPGQHLEPVLIGETLHASITPIRDALHRLAGERLVEAPRHEGFRVPLLTEFALRQLYGWSADLLLLGLKSVRNPDRDRIDGNPIPDRTEEAHRNAASLFRAIGGLSRNPEHQAALSAVLDRLGPARGIEPQILADISGELAMLEELLCRPDLAALRRGIVAYHRRRQRHTPRILEAMHRGICAG
jgi:hypothetical protein